MGTQAYSPYTPQVLGDAWVPITQDAYEAVQGQERGYWFNLSAASTVITSRVYVGENTNSLSTYANMITNIYPENGLDWGPVRQVTLPVTSVIAGTATTVTPGGASTAVQALYSPNSNSYISVVGGASSPSVNLQFDVVTRWAQYAAKRILRVDFMYLGTWEGYSAGGNPYVQAGLNGALTNTYTLGVLSENYNPLAASSAVTTPGAFSLGSVTPFFNGATNPSSSGTMYPYNGVTFGAFSSAVLPASRVYVNLTLANTESYTSGDLFLLYYGALRVTFCEETRVGVGIRNGQNIPPQYGFGPAGTAFSMAILDPTLSQNQPVLTPGNYYVTASAEYSPLYSPQAVPLRALHQLYEMQRPGIKGVNIPLFNIPTEANAAEPSNHIPAISLHTSSGVVSDTHGYGEQLNAPVYSGVVARQGIVNAAAAASTQYSMARFYARRFDGTTSPLGLRVEGTTTPAAVISVEDFDALEEVSNGWKQVDLTFSTPLTFNTSGSSNLEFYSSTSTGSRWEILGARATNVTGYTFSEVGPPDWLAPTTYGGSSQYATWDQGIGTISADLRGDLTLMFATMPQVTGLGVEQEQLDLEVTELCDQVPGGVVSAFTYNRLTWNGSSAGVLGDVFGRTAADSWGNATTGQAWTVGEGSATVWDVTDGEATFDPAAASTSYMIVSAYSAANTTIQATFAPTATPGTQSNVYLVGRYASTSNYYAARLTFNTDGTFAVGLEERVGGATSTLVNPVTVGQVQAGQGVTLKFQLADTLLQAKAWLEDETELSYWPAVTTDTSLTSAGFVGVRGFVGDASVTYTITDLSARNGFGAYELQREDDYTDWQTIMLATEPAVVEFNDFEARVGVESRYRIRACHELDFCGAWSSEVNSTIASPGVEGEDLSTDVLIFTSNVNQDGSSMLAYAEIFDNTPSQEFVLAEASDVMMQPMYNRDYRVAFHGTERGGQVFSRTLLLNNAAMSVINFEQSGQPLRNLAWASLPYVCVRDGHGSRWLANVSVPNVVIQPPRHALQMAQVAITETTGTAYPVDPTP